MAWYNESSYRYILYIWNPDGVLCEKRVLFMQKRIFQFDLTLNWSSSEVNTGIALFSHRRAEVFVPRGVLCKGELYEAVHPTFPGLYRFKMPPEQ